MAQETQPDTEDQRAAIPEHSEQTPLLGDHQSGHDAQAHGEEDEVEKRGRTTSWWVWRGFWVILAGLVLALFIKGWVDAGGDVKVRLSPLCPSDVETIAASAVDEYV